MSDLDELKDLLFGAEKEALDSIAERVERREVRAADVADILPEAIYQSHQKDGELVDSLTDPVGECLQNAFRDDPETFGNALYPVMGPAIRKSIMQALRGFAQQINEAVEHSVSPKGLKWRWEASRAGIPFGQYVLQKTLLYRVEQAYLISRENGLLIDHVHHEASKIKDSDAVSAMFTAIQDFVKESFSPDRTGRLESADMGEFTLWAVHGPHALLVCVIRGVPPRSLRGELSSVLERIHFRYGDAIREYKGDTSSVPDVEVELERCLQHQARQEDEEKGRKGVPVFLIALLLIALAALAYYAITTWRANQQQAALEAALADTPGLYISAVERDGGTFAVQGLQDPLAPTINAVAESVGVQADNLVVNAQAFQSLAPEMIALRAERILSPPDTAELDVTGSTLRVIGDAPWAWQRRLRQNFGSVAGIDSLDASRLTASDRAEFRAATEQMNGQKFFFDIGVADVTTDVDALSTYVSALANHVELARTMDYEILVSLTGSADSLGAEAVNSVLAGNRANYVATVFDANGITVTDLERTVARPANDTDAAAGQQRFVQVELELVSNSQSP